MSDREVTCTGCGTTYVGAQIPAYVVEVKGQPTTCISCRAHQEAEAQRAQVAAKAAKEGKDAS